MKLWMGEFAPTKRIPLVGISPMGDRSYGSREAVVPEESIARERSE